MYVEINKRGKMRDFSPIIFLEWLPKDEMSKKIGDQAIFDVFQQSFSASVFWKVVDYYLNLTLKVLNLMIE